VPSTGLAYDAFHAAGADQQTMIDMFGLALSHGLLMLAAWRLLSRADLDRDEIGGGERGWSALRKAKPERDSGA
jgi:hypothetical protein